MKMTEVCVNCQLNKQAKRFVRPGEMEIVRRMMAEKDEDACAPYISYRYNQLYRELYNIPPHSYAKEKKQYNDLVMSMEDALLERIESSGDPLRTALFLSRTGNYIDYSALPDVSTEEFLELLSVEDISEADQRTWLSFLECLENAGSFLLIADNCGEIVLDKLFLVELGKRFPQLSLSVMVRGKEVVNDATPEDASYVGIDQIARIFNSGEPIAGILPDRLPEDARYALDHSDVILAKGQGNYESLAGSGRHVFYLFLCKCRVFTERFRVPPLTGMFIEEKEGEEGNVTA